MESVSAILTLCGVLVIAYASYRLGCWKQQRKLWGILTTREDNWAIERGRYEEALTRMNNENIGLLNSVDDLVEKRLKEWWPDPKDFDEQWAQAEQMANRRKMRDAGRKTLPRSDANEPGRLHKRPVSLRRVKPANPK